MKFKIITFGKVKNKNLFLEIEELKKRISRIEFVELKEVKEKNIDILKKKEFELIKENISKENYNILLWEHAQELDTISFHKYLKNIDKTICFIITGAYGPNDDLKSLIDMTLSLSKMTYTHEQAQYMLVEQLYRVECIEKNIGYTK